MHSKKQKKKKKRTLAIINLSWNSPDEAHTDGLVREAKVALTSIASLGVMHVRWWQVEGGRCGKASSGLGTVRWWVAGAGWGRVAWAGWGRVAGLLGIASSLEEPCWWWSCNTITHINSCSKLQVLAFKLNWNIYLTTLVFVQLSGDILREVGAKMSKLHMYNT